MLCPSGPSRQLQPDYARVHQELKRAGVTLPLLQEEYQREHADAGEPAYKYTSFGIKYRAWATALKRSSARCARRTWPGSG